MLIELFAESHCVQGTALVLPHTLRHRAHLQTSIVITGSREKIEESRLNCTVVPSEPKVCKLSRDAVSQSFTATRNTPLCRLTS